MRFLRVIPFFMFTVLLVLLSIGISSGETSSTTTLCAKKDRSALEQSSCYQTFIAESKPKVNWALNSESLLGSPGSSLENASPSRVFFEEKVSPAGGQGSFELLGNDADPNEIQGKVPALGSFSFALWVFPRASGTLFSQGSSLEGNYLSLSIEDGALEWRGQRGEAALQCRTEGPVLSSKEWSLLSGTSSGDLYLDGEKVIECPSIGGLDAGEIYLGSQKEGPGDYRNSFSGLISSLTFWGEKIEKGIFAEINRIGRGGATLSLKEPEAPSSVGTLDPPKKEISIAPTPIFGPQVFKPDCDVSQEGENWYSQCLLRARAGSRKIATLRYNLDRGPWKNALDVERGPRTNLFPSPRAERITPGWKAEGVQIKKVRIPRALQPLPDGSKTKTALRLNGKGSLLLQSNALKEGAQYTCALWVRSLGKAPSYKLVFGGVEKVARGRGWKRLEVSGAYSKDCRLQTTSRTKALVTNAMLEKEPAGEIPSAGIFFDGNTPGAFWLGEKKASPSRLPRSVVLGQTERFEVAEKGTRVGAESRDLGGKKSETNSTVERAMQDLDNLEADKPADQVSLDPQPKPDSEAFGDLNNLDPFAYDSMNARTLLSSQGELLTWGEAASGRLGNGTTTPDVTSPAQIGSGTDWDMVAAGDAHSLAIKGGKLYAWGTASRGRLGNGTTSPNVLSPAQIGFDTDWEMVAAGDTHSLAIKGGKLYAWGSNTYGQLGNGTTSSNVTSPAQIGSDTDWEMVAAGDAHSLAIKGGKLYAWGINTYGQLGDGTTTQRNSPTQIGSDTDWLTVGFGSVATHSIATRAAAAKPIATWSGTPSSPNKNTSVGYTLTFSESVTGVAAGDFSNAASSSAATGCSFSPSGSGTAYTVTISSCSEGNLQPQFAQDGAQGSSAAGPASAAVATNILLDRTAPGAPTIGSTSGSPANTNPAASSSVSSTSASFTWTGAEGGGTYQCQLDSGGYSTCTSGSTTYNSLSEGSHTFYVRQVDAAGNTGSAQSRTWTVDTAAPSVSTLTRTSPSSPTNSTTISYSVTFSDSSESVTGFAVGDISNSGTNTYTWSAANLSGSGKTYSFDLVRSGSGSTSGTVVPRIAASAVADSAGNNGPVSPYDGESTTVDYSIPTASWSGTPSSPNKNTSVEYTLTFSESVTGVASGDFSNVASTNAATGCSFSPSGSGTTYTVTVSSCSEGNLQPRFAQIGATDGAGNTGPASAEDATQITFDRTNPTASWTTTPSDPAFVGAFSYGLTFTDTSLLSGLTAGDFSFSGTASGCTFTVPSGVENPNTFSGGSEITISVSCTDAGTFTPTLASNAVTDAANNSGPASSVGGTGVTLQEGTPPEVSSMTRTSPASSPTAAEEFVYSLQFTESVEGFTASGVGVGGTASGVSWNKSISGSGSSYTVTLNRTTSGATYLSQFGTPGDGNGEFANPSNMALDSSGNIYVVDRGNSRVQKFYPSGDYQSQFGTPGDGNGEFSAPTDVAIDSSDNIYVVDQGNSRVQKFYPSGGYQSQFGTYGSGDGELDGPLGIDIDSSDNIYVADAGNSRVQKFYPSGGYQSQFGTPGDGNGEFSAPTDVAIDSSDNIYVLDSGNNRVQKFYPSGGYQSQFGTYGSGDGELDGPFGIDIDSSGNIYVSDAFNDRVQKFDSSGTYNYQSQFGTYGSANGQFNFPAGVETSGSNIYVADAGNSRVQKFSNSQASASSGTVIPFIKSSAVYDQASNYGPSTTYEGPSTTLSLDAPTASWSGTPSSPNKNTSVEYTLTFSESVTGVAAGDFSNSAASGAATGCSFSPSGSGTTYAVTVSGCSEGNLRPRFAAEGAITAASVLAPATAADGETIVLDRTTPALSLEQAAGQDDPTNKSPIYFSFDSDEPLDQSTVTTADFAATGGSLSVSPRENLSTNPSFETNASGYLSSGGGPGDFALTRSSEQSRVGAHSLKVEANVESGGEIFNTPDGVIFSADVLQGNRYSYSIYVRPAQAGSSVQLSALHYNADVTEVLGVSYSTVTSLTNNQWQRVSFSGVAPAGSAKVLFGWAREGGSEEDIFYLDGAMIERAASVRNYFDGNGYINGSDQYVSSGTSWNGTGNLSASKNLLGYNLFLTPSGNGTVSIAPSGSFSVSDTAGNANTPGNSVTGSDRSVVYDTTGPTVSWSGTPSSPNKNTSVEYTLTFSESVTGVAAGDFSNSAASGAATGCSFSPSGSGTTYAVTVSGCSEGNLRPRFAQNGATDTAGNDGPASAADATEIILDRTAPTLTLEQKAGQADPANTAPIEFTFSANENLDSATVAAADFQLTSGGGTISVSGSGSTYTVSIASPSGTVTVAPGTFSVTDTAGNAQNTIANGTDRTVVFDSAAPAITLQKAGGQASYTTTSSIQFTLSADKTLNYSTIASSDFTITNGTWSSISPTSNATSYTITVAASSTGLVSIAPSGPGSFSIADTLGNALSSGAGVAGTDRTVVYDNTAPATPTVSYSGATAGTYGTGNVIYINTDSASSGEITVKAEASDAGSGIKSINLPTPVNFSLKAGSANTKTNSTPSPTALFPTPDSHSATFTWSGSPGGSTRSITATNGTGLTNTSAFYQVIVDNSAPSGGALTVNSVAASGAGSTSENNTGSFSISRTDYTVDAYSGIATSILIREKATLSNNTCGTTWTESTTITGAAAQNGLTAGCYRYTLTGTDNVGNTSLIRTTVKVDTTPPSTPEITLQNAGGNTYISGSTVYVNPQSGRSGGFEVSATSADSDTGLASITFPSPSGYDRSSYRDTMIDILSSSDGEDALMLWSLGATSGSDSLVQESVIYNAAPAGGLTLGTHTPGPLTAGDDGATTFDGADDRIESSYTSQYTADGYMLWIRPTSFASSRTLISGSSADSPTLYIDTGGDVRFRPAGSSATNERTWDTNLATQSWYHLAMNRNVNDGTISLYLNGSLLSTQALGPYGTGGVLRVGARASTTDPYIGQMAWFAGMLREFSAEEVALAYLSGKRATAAAQTTSPYKVAYTWSGSTATTGTQNVKATNTLGLDSANATFTIQSETTNPTGGALTVNGTAATTNGSESNNYSGQWTIGTRTSWTDAGVGIKSNILKVERATYDGTTCDATWTFILNITGSPNQDLPSGYCYRYTLTGADQVGNKAAVSTTVKVKSSQLYSWGSDNSSSQLGRTANDAASRSAVRAVSTFGSLYWTQSASGINHSLGIFNTTAATGFLAGWGGNGSSQLAPLSSSTISIPAALSPLPGWTDVAAGNLCSLAIRNGELYAMGNNASYRTGLNTSSGNTTSITKVGSIQNWTDISAGFNHSLAIRDDGSLYSWGNNAFGKTGQNVQGADSYTTTPSTVFGSISGWTKASAGFRHSAGIANGGRLYAWGDDTDGNAGNGATTGNVLVPTNINGSSTGWTDVSAGDFHTLAIRNGQLYSWGADPSGELGNGAGGSSTVTSPTLINSDTNWQSVSAGIGYSYAIKGGELYGWGTLNGTTVHSPSKISNFTDWSTLSQGSYANHSIAARGYTAIPNVASWSSTLPSSGATNTTGTKTWSITLTNAVEDLAIGDFALTAPSGWSLGSLSGSGSEYSLSVTCNSSCGQGAIEPRLNADSITVNSITGPAKDYTGEAIVYDTVSPTITAVSGPESPQAGGILFNTVNVQDTRAGGVNKVAGPKTFKIQYDLQGGSAVWEDLPTTPCANQTVSDGGLLGDTAITVGEDYEVSKTPAFGSAAVENLTKACWFDSSKLADGTYNLRVVVEDRAGNQATQSLDARASTAGTVDPLVIRNSSSLSVSSYSATGAPSNTNGTATRVVGPEETATILVGAPWRYRTCVGSSSPNGNPRNSSTGAELSPALIRVNGINYGESDSRNQAFQNPGPVAQVKGVGCNSEKILVSTQVPSDTSIAVRYNMLFDLSWTGSPGAYSLPLDYELATEVYSYPQG